MVGVKPGVGGRDDVVGDEKMVGGDWLALGGNG